MKKFIENVLVFVSVLVLIWMLASWNEILAKNTNPDSVYSQWNYFIKMDELITTWRV